jgi:aldehyde:ferredoxin oxidoreductase
MVKSSDKSKRKAKKCDLADTSRGSPALSGVRAVHRLSNDSVAAPFKGREINGEKLYGYVVKSPVSISPTNRWSLFRRPSMSEIYRRSFSLHKYSGTSQPAQSLRPENKLILLTGPTTATGIPTRKDLFTGISPTAGRSSTLSGIAAGSALS